MKRVIVSEKRSYRVHTVGQAKKIAFEWTKSIGFEKAVSFGLPEVDDRYHIWRIALTTGGTSERIGEIVIDANSSLVDLKKTTKESAIRKRLLKAGGVSRSKKQAHEYPISSLRNTIALGDSKDILADMPAESVDLVFTSPPYYNAETWDTNNTLLFIDAKANPI